MNMNRVFAASFLTIAILLSSCSHQPRFSERAPEIPLKAFFKNPDVTSYQISPDGKKVAYLKPWKTRMNVFVRTLPNGKEKRLTRQTKRDIAGFYWKESQHILYVRDFGGDENYHVFSVNVKTGREKDLTPFKGVKARVVDDLDEIDPSHILVSLNKRNRKFFDVYRLNVKTGRLRLKAKNPGNFTSWLADHKGNIRVATATDGVNTSLFFRDSEKDKFEKILETNFREDLTPLFFTFDNKNLFVASNLGRDRISIAEFNPKTKKEVRVLYEHPEVDVTRLSYSKKRKKLIAAIYFTDKRGRHFFDSEFEEIFSNLKKKITKEEISISSHSRDEQLLTIRTGSDRSKGSYYLYDRKKDELTLLGHLSPWLNPEELAEMKPIRYRSRDGLKIRGYLTLPKGYKGGRIPVVVNPHGGPWYRDYWGFNSEVQFLANRGYAVLQMNFRGSTGFGRKFWEASFKQWGKKMQDDITDGVKWLIKKNIADPKRICIYGASYGGYATLAGLAFTPDLYACGVDYVGISNLFTFMETIPPYWKPYLEMLYEMVGHPEKDADLLRSGSPFYHADKIKAPLFVAQGAKDPRVKKSESDQIVAALKKRNIDVPYLVKENEGHGFRNEENRFEFYEKAEKFLARYLKQPAVKE